MIIPSEIERTLCSAYIVQKGKTMNSIFFNYSFLAVRTSILVALCLLACPGISQLVINVNVTDATCTSNGSIEAVVVSGGSGNYNYQLESTCLSIPLIQNTNVFSSLEPCSYILTVTDGTSGETVQENVVVGGNYEPLILSLDCSGCSITTFVENGLAPYQFSISTSGLGGVFTPNTPPDNPVFSNLETNQVYYIKVTDECGASESFQCYTQNYTIDFSVHLISDSLIVKVYNSGGTAYTYTLDSDIGTFTNNSGGFYIADQLGCNASMTVSDGCLETTESIPFKPKLLGLCPNFADGTATMEVVATPPFTVSCLTPSGVFQSTTGEFVGLPVNASYYVFSVINNCGVSSGSYWRFLPSPAFPLDPAACNSDTLALISGSGNCLPGFGNTKLPIVVQCLSCPDSPVDTIDNQSAILETGTPGALEISLIDNCGDHLVCQDELLLDIQPYCDSLRATLIDRFFCDNGTSSDRMIKTDGSMYYLSDSTGMVVDSNSSGLFQGLAPGQYAVKFAHPVCGFFEGTTEVGIYLPFHAQFSASIFSRVMDDGSCKPTYRLRFPKNNGEMLLTGNGQTILIDDQYLDFLCKNYYVHDLLPGEYIISPLGYCGQDTIYLPMPEYGQLQAIADGTCPGAGMVTAEGANSFSYWINWENTLDIDIDWSDNAIDHYGLDNDHDADYTGSPYTFLSVPPGEHTVYLYAFDHTCPLDTEVVTVAEPVLLSTELIGGILCDGATTTDLELAISGGKLPYTVEEVDCSSPSTILSTITVADSIVHFTGVTQGDHCYRVIDGCLSGLGEQRSVRFYQDSIDISYNCDNTITLSLDSVQANYFWKNTNGDLLGTARQLVLPAPNMEMEIFASIDIGSCTIERSIVLPPVQLVPNIEIIGEEIMCEGQTLDLAANTSASVISWNTGSVENQIEINQPGLYTVTVTNDYGCTATDSLLVNEAPALVPVIFGDLSICPGAPNLLWTEGSFGNVAWSNGAIGDSILIADTGLLTVMVTDTFGCTWEGSAIVTEHLLPQPVIVGDSVVCENKTTTLSLSQDFDEYIWSDGSNEAMMLAGAGSHSVTVIDSNGCIGFASVNVMETPSIIVSLTGDTLVCSGEPVSLGISVLNVPSGIELTFDYPVLPNTLFILHDTSIIITVPQNSLIAIESASAAGYQCPFIFPDTVIVMTDQVEVKAYSLQPFSGFEISCNGKNDGSASAKVISGISPFTYQWSNSAKTADITGLYAGSYTVTVTDSLGCEAQYSIILNEPAPISVEMSTQPPWCFGENDGVIDIQDWNGGAGGLGVSLNGGEYYPVPTSFANLPSGEYTLVFEDGNHCIFDTSLYFAEPVELALDLGADVYVEFGNSIQLQPLANFLPASFSYTPTTWLDDPGSWMPYSMPFDNISYSLKAWDEHGCSVTAELFIRVDKTKVAIYAPTAFSPNNDGINDSFTLFANESAVTQINYLRIFNRWGNLVFEQNYFGPNQVELGWDGTFNGEHLKPGLFVWVAEVVYVDGRRRMLEGGVQLVR